MLPNLFRTKDFWAGLFLIIVGALAAGIARNYPMGSALRMGAGYFPMVLGWILVVFGVILLLRGFISTDRIDANWSPRAFIVIPLALAAFGLLLERAGFIPALFAVIIGSAAAGSEFRPIEVLVMALALTAMCVAVFIWGLGLPYSLIVSLW